MNRDSQRGVRPKGHGLLVGLAAIGAVGLVGSQAGIAAASRGPQATASRSEAAAVAASAPSSRGRTAENQLFSLHNDTIASVVAPNGDQNPYGIAIVPKTEGRLVAGDLLVADFNNKAGTPGAGTTILLVNPNTRAKSVFASGLAATGPVGIAINPVNDIVWVGNYGPKGPTGAYDGSAASVTVISPTGVLLTTFDNASTGTHFFNGVWGQAESDVNGHVAFYWPNAGDAATGKFGGGIWRLNPDPMAAKNGQPLNSTYTLIGSGLASTPARSTAATAEGPQGMVFDPANGTLYVADDANNSILGIADAGTRMSDAAPAVILKGGILHSPQGLAINPTNGDLLVVNGSVNNDLVELTTAGKVVAARNIAPREAPGALFGLATTSTSSGGLNIYYVDDDTNTVNILSGTAPSRTSPYSGY
jgi:sugar lactone lactonase YvrE